MGDYIDGVSIVLPACEEGDWVRSTVANFHADIPEAEIVVVDDASTDGCCDGLPEFVKIIRNEERKGVGGARNTGMDAASGDTFIVADAHVEVLEPGSLRTIVRLAKDRGAFAVPQFRSIPKPRKDGTPGAMKGPRWGGHFLFMRDQYLGWQYERKREEMEYPIEVPNGGCYAFTRAIRDKLGLWPTTAGLWGHNPVTKGLLCWYTDTPAILTCHAQIAHAYKAPHYVLKLEYQWQNACRTYSIVFAERTYRDYWKPILSRVLGEPYVDNMWEGTRAERAVFAESKRHNDVEFFAECLHAPVISYSGSVSAVPRVSVIVPCYNEGGMIKDTVESIRESNKFDHDIVVVDDASTDGCCKKLRREVDTPIAKNIQRWMHEQHELAARKKALAGNRKGCMVLRNETRQGVSGSRNAGCEAVKDYADILLFSDGHVIWEPDTVRRLAQTVIDTGGIVTSSFANWRERPADATKRIYGANLALRPKRGLGASYRRTEPDSDVSPVPHIIGSVYGMWQETLDAIGGWIHIDGGQWGCAEAFVTIAAYFQGIPLNVDKRCFVRHMLTDHAKSNLKGYIQRVHLLHELPFGAELYEAIFKPVIDDLGPLERDHRYERAAYAYSEAPWSKRIKSELDFMRDYLPEYLEQYEALSCGPTAEAQPVEETTVPKVKPSQLEFVPDSTWLEGFCCARAGFTILVDKAGTTYFMQEAYEGESTRVMSSSGISCCPFCGTPVADMQMRPPAVTLGVQTHMQHLQEQSDAKPH